MSPCSPKSISSVSASESTGCPSPADNYCDVRELRGKIDLVLGKCSEKGSGKGDDMKDSNCDLPDRNKENESKDNSKSKKRKVKACKETELVVKLERTVANQGTSVKSETESGNDSKVDAESGDTLSKNDDVKKDCKNVEKEDNLKKDDVSDEKEAKKSDGSGSPLDEGGGDDLGDCGDKADFGTPMDNQGQEGTDVEDAVDVVNSPSSTSVDSDDRGERKTERKSKKKVEGKTEAKNTDASGDADVLEYKLNDRIDVRYGRGRNATIYHAKVNT